MTKKQMIEVIQQKEAEAFLQVQIDEAIFGIDDKITIRSRAEWCKINGLMEDLEIKPDNTLSANQTAMAYIMNKNKKQLKEEALN